MSHSPSISSQPSDKKSESLYPHANFLNSQRNLFYSTVSMELNRHEQCNLISSKVNLFCEQQKILAEKDLRIQELLMELRYSKDEASSTINQLQENVNQLLKNNQVLEAQISYIMEQKNLLILEKEKSFESLNSKVEDGAFNIEETKSLYEDSLVEQEKMENEMKDEEVDAIERNRGESGNKSHILSYLEEESQSLEEGITRERLRALEEKEKLLCLFGESFCKQLDLSESEKRLFLNEPLESMICTFLEELKEQREETNRLKELYEIQAISILDLEKIVQQQIYDRRQLLDEKNKLKESLQTETNLSEELKDLKEKFNKLSEEKRIVELELFRVKMDIEESKNISSLDFKNMVYSIGEEQRFNINSPSTIQERAESEEQSTPNSVTCDLNIKINELHEILLSKDARLNELETRFKNYTESMGKIYELSKEFDSEFCSFVDSSQAKKSEIFERIARNLKDRQRFDRDPVQSIIIPNDEGNEDECYENLGVTYTKELI